MRKQSNTPDISNIFPNFPDRPAVIRHLKSSDALWSTFNQLSEETQEMIIGFFLGQNGLPITSDAVFRRIFDPEIHRERVEALLTAIFGRSVKIVQILPREGSQLTERGSFVVMDILVVLDNGDYADIEMQKIGYKFPIERSDCYSADMIRRQYNIIKSRLKDNFSFKVMKKVFCIVLMEQSAKCFRELPDRYRHHRYMTFDTNIMKEHTGLCEDFFLCLDIFRQNIHNVDTSSSALDVWLMFLSSTDINAIRNLITEFPEFIPIYREIVEFTKNPEVLLNMFSEALYIMDRNTERLMVTELQEENDSLKNMVTEQATALAEKDNALAEKDKLIAELQTQLAQKQ